MSSRFDDLLIAAGGITADGTVTLPDDSVEGESLKEFQHALQYGQDDGSDIVAAIAPLHLVKGASATVTSIQVACVDSPSGGDKAFSVDLKKCSESSPTPASVLTGAIDYANGTADCHVVSGTISSAGLVTGDILVVVIVVSGTIGVQGQGLVVTVNVLESRT